MKRLSIWMIPGVILASVTNFAFGHAGHGPDGLSSGLAHPFLGIDHVLAMIAVGLWASQLRGRMMWMVPAAFVGVLAIGGVLGMTGVWLPGVESGILASLVVLGLLIAMALKPSAAICLGLVALFALLHGHAHGTELAAGASAVSYSVGFMLATAALHVLGIGLGVAMQWARQIPLTRLSGAGIALAGLALWIS